MSKRSIMQTDKKCLVCGTDCNLHLHHIYGGANRKVSDKMGFTVYLCGYHHNLSPHGVHSDYKLNLKIKQMCQKKFEETHSRQEFVSLIGKNFLED